MEVNMKRVYILVRWDRKDNFETILKAYTDEKMAKADLELLEKTKGRKVFIYFVTEAELVEEAWTSV